MLKSGLRVVPRIYAIILVALVVNAAVVLATHQVMLSKAGDPEISQMASGVDVTGALLITLAGLMVTAGAALLLARSVLLPLGRLTRCMTDLSEDDRSGAIPYLDRRDEFGDMAAAIAVLRNGLAQRDHLLLKQEARAERDAVARAAAQAETAAREAAAEAERKSSRQREAAERQSLLAEQALENARKMEEQDFVVAALAKGLQALAEGKLDARIDAAFPETYDKLRSDFNETMETLSAMVGSIAWSAEEMRGKGQEISRSAEEVAHSSEKSAATLEETAAALEELTVSVAQAASGAKKADLIAAEARQTAQRSDQVVRQTASAMDAIESSSHKISKIIDVIDDIAFQTNLLALNAGVEAARAGEAGRGFAVVASEVRALAQRSSGAAGEINSLISESGSHVKRGVSLVDEAGQTLETIARAVSDIAGHVSDIALSANEQATGISDINAAVGQLDVATQHNTAMFQDTLMASKSLTHTATELAAKVARFETSTKSGNGAFLATRAPDHSQIAVVPHPLAEPLRSRKTVAGGSRPDLERQRDWKGF